MDHATKIAGPSIDVHGVTDPGNPAKENQDTFFTLRHRDHVVLAVFDGHGSACGLLASSTARDFFREKLSLQETYVELEAQPERTLRRLFHDCHLAIKAALRQRYEDANNNVQERKGGFLVIKPTLLQRSVLVQGGTTASIVIILHGTRLLCANVGDSAVLLASGSAVVSDTSWKALSSMLRVHCAHGPRCSQPPDMNAEQVKPPLLLLLTGEHSPEAKSEFETVARQRHAPHAPLTPELLFLYDSIVPGVSSNGRRLTLREKHALLERHPVFCVRNNREIASAGEGSYYKNVRQEWASLCCTPGKAKYHESLAFTRSLGDFYMHHYGITHEPDIFEVALDKLDHGDHPPTFSLLLASDGIWDSWQYGEAAAFVVDALGTGNAEAAATSLLSRNKQIARDVFGSQVDNMTAIVASIRYHAENQ
ncbi:hypothetical protein SDRG_05326 [Saprolegnia diclina VS20]|uniref:PPM-type phosphatase domain-containing protein n=1 Tax=Saprolegnia diclina (strain VS20) TaxID=1156394 RepID=T0QGK6_SAPDV|nr:hypothetical protein SDRG_05326 [Saprolegnia diclina VS20]EQC37099.1 hypothetical protein SDRG_05326 [Saprolegnia diclina VS20]|eukprot:XP_008609261.1 hypothetical protein SDRG_05326 [Saprolegnia diclina VS20]